jgi:hypothetical protein
LKLAIDQVALPLPANPDPVFLNYRFQVAKLATFLDALQLKLPSLDTSKSSKETEKTSKEREKLAKDAEKNLEKYTKLAEESMKGCESLIQGELRRTGDTIEGFLEINECALKYIGSVIADKVKEYVQN